MSHYLTLVIVSRELDESEIENEVDRLLLPHSDVDAPDNPNAECDGWVIGGRFDAQIYGAPSEHSLTPAEFQTRYGFEVIELRDNVRAVGDIPDSFLPNVDVIVTRDGEWYSCLDPQFADPACKNPASGPKWIGFLKNTLNNARDSFGVVVDAHY